MDTRTINLPPAAAPTFSAAEPVTRAASAPPPPALVTSASATDESTSTVPGPRRRPTAARASSPVEVRSMSNPKDGWSLADAVRMLEQGYGEAVVEKRTGYAAAHVRAQLQRRP